MMETDPKWVAMMNPS